MLNKYRCVLKDVVAFSTLGDFAKLPFLSISSIVTLLQMIWFIHCPSNRPFIFPSQSSCLMETIISFVINLEYSQTHLLGVGRDFEEIVIQKAEETCPSRVAQQLMARLVKNAVLLNLQSQALCTAPLCLTFGLLGAVSKEYAERASGSPLTSTSKYVPVWFSYTEYGIFQESHVCFIYSV